MYTVFHKKCHFLKWPQARKWNFFGHCVCMYNVYVHMYDCMNKEKRDIYIYFVSGYTCLSTHLAPKTNAKLHQQCSIFYPTGINSMLSLTCISIFRWTVVTNKVRKWITLDKFCEVNSSLCLQKIHCLVINKNVDHIHQIQGLRR